jgi:uncharacterized membrane protein
MGTLAAFSALFFVLHRIVSGSRVRDRIVALIGEAPFRRAFALASLLCLTGLWIGYQQAAQSPRNIPIFSPSDASKLAQLPIQLIAVFLVVAGVTTRNPTIAGLGSSVTEGSIVRGVLRITRHPFLWGVSLFAAGHMLASPTISSWGFFGTLLFLAGTGTISIDAKRLRALGADWKAFAAATSNVPFVAIVQGRQSLALAEIGWMRVVVSAGAFGLLLAVHGFFFDVSAYP